MKRIESVHLEIRNMFIIRILPHLVKEIPDGTFGKEAVGVVGRAVSYTHLDVYKRQASPSPPPRAS